MKKRFIFSLMIFFTVLMSPLLVSADDITSELRSKFNIEDFVNTSKPFKMENGELVDTSEYFKDGIESISDRKSTRLNSSHVAISYAVFCLKKKRKKEYNKSNKRHARNK